MSGIKKEVEISAKMNSADFDRDIERMKKQLKELYQPADNIRSQASLAGKAQSQGFGGMSMPSQQAMEQATQKQRRDLDASIRDQINGHNALAKKIEQRVAVQEKLVKLSKDENVALEQRIRYQETLNNLSGNIAKQNQKLAASGQLLGQALDSRANPANMPPPPPGGYSGPATTFGSGTGKGMMGLVGGGLTIAGLIAGLIKSGSSMYRGYGNAPVETASAMGSATQATSGRALGDIYGGRSSFENLWSGERKKAIQMSRAAMDSTRKSDMADAMGGILGQGAVGAGVGTGIGAGIGGAMGSVLPFVGTAIGAGVGMGPGAAIGGGIGMLSGAFSDPRRRAMLLSGVSSTYKNQYESILQKEFADKYTSSYQGLKDQNPYKKEGFQDFEKNFDRNLGAQRAMGLSGEEFRGDGGYLNSITNAGFGHAQGIGMSNSILGAGGSTQMARGSAFGLQLERMGLTNSGSVLGKLSGSLGSESSTKSATIAIMSEAVSRGLDMSKFSEENRKFTEAAAGVISRTGATGEADQDRISHMFGQFLGSKTTAGIQSAGNSYESFQQKSSELGGRGGVLRMVSAMNDPILSKLNQNDLTQFLEMRPDEMNENNPLMHSFAKSAGTDIKSLIKSSKGVNRQGLYTLPGQLGEVDESVKNIGSYNSSKKMTMEQFEEAIQNGTLDSEGMSLFGKLQTAQGRTGNKKDFFDARSEGFMELNGGNSISKSSKKDILEGLDSAKRPEDKFLQGLAGDAEFTRKNFSDLSADLNKAAEAAANMTQAARKMYVELSNMVDPGTPGSPATRKPNAAEEWLESTFGVKNPYEQQSQSGKGGGS